MSWRSLGSTRAPEGAASAFEEAEATFTATGERRAAEGAAIFAVVCF